MTSRGQRPPPPGDQEPRPAALPSWARKPHCQELAQDPGPPALQGLGMQVLFLPPSVWESVQNALTWGPFDSSEGASRGPLYAAALGHFLLTGGRAPLLTAGLRAGRDGA